jgi:TolB-like protein/DNA-binding winged helix-turn-helix (wHTH) protein
MKYVAGDILIDSGRQSVSRAGVVIALPKLSYDLFLVLIRAAPDVVSLDELMRQVWRDVVVSPETVGKRVTLLRAELGDDPRLPRYIAGLRGRGYHVIAPVSELTDVAPDPQATGGRGAESATPPASDDTASDPGATSKSNDSDSVTHNGSTLQSPRPAGDLLRASFLTILLAVAIAVGVYWRINAISGLTPSPRDRSIAVLPFLDLSEKKDQEYFADGIAEEALDRLAKVPGLRVVGRASSFQFKGKATDASRVGAALGVAYILEGGVRREAGRVRVTAQLVDVGTGSQRWSDRFDSDLIDVLNVQDTIAAEIARALQLAVEVSATSRSTVKSPEALESYLRGLHALDRFTQEGCEEAVAHFQQALIADPSFTAAATGIARAYAFIGEQGWLPPHVAFERARDAAQLALRLDPKGPRPHVALAQIHLVYDWDWAGVDRELQQAFALGSRDTYGIRIASQLAAAQGRWDEARQLGIEAIALDPLDPEGHGVLGWTVYARYGHLAAAEQSLRRSLQIAPQWGSGRYFLGEVLMLQGYLDAALTVFRQETLDDGQLEGSAMVHFAAGRKADSDARLADAIARNGSSWPSEIARVYAFRGEKDHAFEWLNRAFDMHDEDLYFIKGDPLLKNLEGDPRFKAFLRKMNLSE